MNIVFNKSIMEIYRFAFIILLSSLLVSCGEKKQETGNADKAAEKKTPAFTLPEVPVMLQSVEDRLHFVVNHYWDKFDLKIQPIFMRPTLRSKQWQIILIC